MKKFILFITFFSSIQLFGQNEFMAKEYLQEGAFEKAKSIYEKLYEKSPHRWDFVVGLIESNQQLELYADAEKTLIDYLGKSYSQPAGYVLLGQNYILQQQQEKAYKSFEKAIEYIEINPNYIYNIAKYFEQFNQLDFAIKAYQLASKGNDKLNFDYQIASLFGQQGNLPKMFEAYFSLIESNPSFLYRVQRNLNEFITDSPENEANVIFRKQLLKNAQTQPNVLWNQLLSWLFVQQKEFQKAFAQEKAVYNRFKTDFSGIMEIASMSYENQDDEVAKQAYQFVIDNAFFADDAISAHLKLLEIKQSQTKPEWTKIQSEYETLLNQYGRSPESLNLQLAYANFIAFYINQSTKAIDFLKKTLLLDLNLYQSGRVKMVLGDILVYQEKFNEALIYYSQIESQLKNDVMAQDARFKIAKTSFYKGDFDWAQTQLKVLKSSYTQLIANDALQLHLLISELSEDGTLHIALKKFARADWLAFKKKPQEAIGLLEDILNQHAQENIIDNTLYRQAQLYELTNQPTLAEKNYQQMIQNYPDELLIDEAYFSLAKLYINILNEPEKAKPLLEKIIFEHEDSIHFTDAKRIYRTLRGDTTFN
ncbi:MAG: hypothetical protein CO119_06280 [Flavobacteriales bacterium CG_4_9_14_3_um_filter_40_17]|nr:MAG: hypothetical protein CO119_06280 [Flavobacteriales bacterium CG_4_9_14_3_um_filter_40_17]